MIDYKVKSWINTIFTISTHSKVLLKILTEITLNHSSKFKLMIHLTSIHQLCLI